MHKLSREDRTLINQILTPSWLSGLIAVIAGLAICIGVGVAFHYNNTSVQQQIISWQQSKPQRALTTPDQELEENDQPTLAGSWPLILLWSAVGLVVYAIAAYIVHSIQSAKQLKDSLGYTHTDRTTVIKSTIEHFLIRFIALLLFVGGCSLFVNRVIPYSITAARSAAVDLFSASGTVSFILSFASVTISLHILTVLLRLALARPRVF